MLAAHPAGMQAAYEEKLKQWEATEGIEFGKGPAGVGRGGKRGKEGRQAAPADPD